MRRTSAREAAALWWAARKGSRISPQQVIAASAGDICGLRLESGSLCLRVSDHHGPHRDFRHVDHLGTSWDERDAESVGPAVADVLDIKLKAGARRMLDVRLPWVSVLIRDI